MDLKPKIEKGPALKAGDEKEKKKGVSCFTLFWGFLLGLFLLLLLSLAGIALAVSATGLFEVPVLSKIIKPPALEEDFSYQKVSQAKLDQKLKVLEEQELITITLTDDELNTILNQSPAPSAPAEGEGALKSILVKFTPGIIKISGVLNQNEAPFYLDLHIEKTKDNFEFSFEKVRLGALPLPSGLVTIFVANFIGIEIAPFQEASPEGFPAQEIVVSEGKISIKKLDLRTLFGSLEK